MGTAMNDMAPQAWASACRSCLSTRLGPNTKCLSILFVNAARAKYQMFVDLVCQRGSGQIPNVLHVSHPLRPVSQLAMNSSFVGIPILQVRLWSVCRNTTCVRIVIEYVTHSV